MLKWGLHLCCCWQRSSSFFSHIHLLKHTYIFAYYNSVVMSNKYYLLTYLSVCQGLLKVCSLVTVLSVSSLHFSRVNFSTERRAVFLQHLSLFSRRNTHRCRPHFRCLRREASANISRRSTVNIRECRGGRRGVRSWVCAKLVKRVHKFALVYNLWPRRSAALQDDVGLRRLSLIIFCLQFYTLLGSDWRGRYRCIASWTHVTRDKYRLMNCHHMTADTSLPLSNFEAVIGAFHCTIFIYWFIARKEKCEIILKLQK